MSDVMYYVKNSSSEVKYLAKSLDEAKKVAIALAILDEYGRYEWEVNTVVNLNEVLIYSVTKEQAEKLLEIALFGQSKTKQEETRS